MPKKGEAFSLFDEGKTSIDLEVKALILKHAIRYSYHSEWRKLREFIYPSPEVASEAK